MNPVLFAGAVLGLLSVIVGASVEHLLKNQVDAEVFRWTMTAIRYHQIGALAVLALGLALVFDIKPALGRWLTISAVLFVIGTVLFSFSIYAAALTGYESLTLVTPLGGLTLMAAWACLVWAAARHGRSISGRA